MSELFTDYATKTNAFTVHKCHANHISTFLFILPFSSRSEKVYLISLFAQKRAEKHIYSSFVILNHQNEFSKLAEID